MQDKQRNKNKRRVLVIIWSTVLATVAFIIVCVVLVMWQGWTIGVTNIVVIATIIGVMLGIFGLLFNYLQLHNSNSDQTVQNNVVADPISGGPVVILSSIVNEPHPTNQTGQDNLFPKMGDFLILEGSEDLQNEDFFGRDEDIDFLIREIMQKRRRVVTIHGKGGVGKTRLAVKLVKKVQDNFTDVVGISLRNAPPLKKVLYECIYKLLPYIETPLPDNVEACIARVIQILCTKRYLLFFDNCESVLQSDNVHSGYIDGYEEYGYFFEMLAKTEHKSCLLMTSRESYRQIQSLEGRFVLNYLLHGLNMADGRKLLESQDLSGGDLAKEQLIDLYSGNPLALKLASEYIRDLNDGAIESFLVQDMAAIDEIDNLLEHQFARITGIEREIMYSLAISLEPITLKELQENYFSRKTLKQGELSSALRSLKRRDLVESGEGKFSLQNVIMDYTIRVIGEKAYQEIKACSFDILEKYAILRASGRNYVRENQVRLILHPLLERLRKSFGRGGPELLFKKCLDALRQQPSSNGHSYVAGNIINLWIQGGLPAKGADFSNLVIREAYFQGVELPSVNFTNTDLETSIFTDTFGDVFSVALHSTPHNELLAAGTSTNEVRLWKRHIDGNVLWRIFSAHTDWVRTVAFSSDNHLLASGSDDQDIYLWSIDEYQHFKKERPLRKLSGHKGRVYTVAFSPDGRKLLSGSQDTTVKLWDVSTGKVLNEFLGHTGTVYSVAFSPDGQTIISGSEDHSIRIWSVETGQLINSLVEHDDEVQAVVFSPDGTIIASGSRDHTIRLWDMHAGTLLKIFKTNSAVGPIVFGSKGRIILSGEEDGIIKLWYIDDDKRLQTLAGHNNRVWSLALSTDENTLISGGRDQSIRIWDIGTGRCIQTQLGSSTWTYIVAFNADGEILASGSGGDSKIRLWNPHTGDELQVLQSEGWVRSVAFHPNGRLLASAGDDSNVRIWDIVNGQQTNILRGHTHVIRSIAFSQTGDLIASAGEDKTIRIWDTASGDCKQIIETLSDIWSIAFHPDGRHLASAGDDLEIHLWDLQSPQHETLLKGHTGWVYFVIYSPDGEYLASCSQDQTIRLWSLKSPDSPLILTGHTSWVHAAAFNPEGTLLITVSQDQTLRQWDILTGVQQGIVGEHAHWIYTTAFSPDGHTIASGSGDGVIKLWDINSRICTRTFHNIGPYENMDITNVKGLESAQMEILRTLGAVEKGLHDH